MSFNDQWRRLNVEGAPPRSRFQSVAIKVLAATASLILLASAVIVSIVLFAGLLAIGVAFGLYVWWKSRHLRAEIKAAQEASPEASSIIEGEVVSSTLSDLPKSDEVMK